MSTSCWWQTWRSLQPPFKYSSRILLPIKVTPCVCVDIYLRSMSSNVFTSELARSGLASLLISILLYQHWVMWTKLYETASFYDHPKVVLVACHWFHKVIEWHLRNFPPIFLFFIEQFHSPGSITQNFQVIGLLPIFSQSRFVIPIRRYAHWNDKNQLIVW